MEPLALLKGHAASVLATEASPHHRCVLLSGSEDRTARLWDDRSRSASLVLRAELGDVAAVAFDPDDEQRVVVSSGGALVSFDLRRANWRDRGVETGHVVQDAAGDADGDGKVEAVEPGRVVQASEDEVNAVVFGPQRVVAVCDDVGAFSLFDADRLDLKHRVKNAHGESLCTSGAFQHSKKKQTRLVTGGLDSMVRVWDVASRQQLFAFNAAQPPASVDKHKMSPFINPPYVNALDVCGDVAAAALGNSEVALYSLMGQCEIMNLSGHRSGVGCVRFGRTKDDTQQQQQQQQQQRLYSVGNDSALIAWDVTCFAEAHAAVDDDESGMNAAKKKKHRRKVKKLIQQQLATAVQQQTVVDNNDDGDHAASYLRDVSAKERSTMTTSLMLDRIRLDERPNWLALRQDDGARAYVATASNNIVVVDLIHQ